MLVDLTDKNIKKALAFSTTGIIPMYILDLFSNDTTIKNQKETALEIIKAGKQNNVDKIELVLDQSAGIDIAADIDNMANVKAKIGTDGKMRMKIKYK